MKLTNKQNENKGEKSGANGSNFYYIEIRPPQEFKTFRVHIVGTNKRIERVAGQRSDGSWKTVKWIIGRELAHPENGKLVADHSDVRQLFEEFSAEPKYIKDNRFEAKELIGAGK